MSSIALKMVYLLCATIYALICVDLVKSIEVNKANKKGITASDIKNQSKDSKPTLDRMVFWKNYTQAIGDSKNLSIRIECQTASDCMSHQICFLPTNECKDQLGFSLSQRSSCTSSSDCKENEICYLNTKTCVCEINSVEISGKCVSLTTVNCTSPYMQKYLDAYGWEIHPFCAVWGEFKNVGTIHLGDYFEGTGLGKNPMIFHDGSEKYCRKARVSSLQYLCYCDEFTCTNDVAASEKKYFVGEFENCVYSFFVFTPLVCNSIIA